MKQPITVQDVIKALIETTQAPVCDPNYLQQFAAWGENAEEVARYMLGTNQAQFGD